MLYCRMNSAAFVYAPEFIRWYDERAPVSDRTLRRSDDAAADDAVPVVNDRGLAGRYGSLGALELHLEAFVCNANRCRRWRALVAHLDHGFELWRRRLAINPARRLGREMTREELVFITYRYEI